MSDVEIRTETKDAQFRLNAMAKAAVDLRPLLAGAINRDIDEMFQRHFETEGAYGGTPWEPLTEATLLIRSMRGRGHGGILRDTNRLWASLTKGGDGPDAVKIITPTEIIRGTNVVSDKGFPYARALQSGWTSSWAPLIIVRGGRPARVVFRRRRIPVEIPARPPIPAQVPRDMRDRWAERIAKFIAEAGTEAT